MSYYNEKELEKFLTDNNRTLNNVPIFFIHLGRSYNEYYRKKQIENPELVKQNILPIYQPVQNNNFNILNENIKNNARYILLISNNLKEQYKQQIDTVSMEKECYLINRIDGKNFHRNIDTITTETNILLDKIGYQKINNDDKLQGRKIILYGDSKGVIYALKHLEKIIEYDIKHNIQREYQLDIRDIFRKIWANPLTKKSNAILYSTEEAIEDFIKFLNQKEQQGNRIAKRIKINKVTRVNQLFIIDKILHYNTEQRDIILNQFNLKISQIAKEEENEKDSENFKSEDIDEYPGAIKEQKINKKIKHEKLKVCLVLKI